MNFLKKINKYIRSKQRIAVLLFAIVVVPFFSGCGEATNSTYKVNLEIWGTFDDSSAYTEIIKQYKLINPYVGEIKFRKFAENSYQQELIDALASGQGPDIFLINNGWLPAFENKVEPSPEPLLAEQEMKSSFPDVVASDFLIDGKAYAVPLSVDSMALYYNKDLFNAAGITAPPQKWDEFEMDVQKLTKINPDGTFKISGAAIGTATNVKKAADLLSLLMFQNGVNLPIKKGTSVKLEEGVMGGDGKIIPAGEKALGFYTNFSKLNSSSILSNPLYTWNARQHYSADAFVEGSVAMIFGYSWQANEIKKLNPKLNFGTANVPQVYPDNPVNIANYWAYAVAKNKITSASATGKTTVSVTNEMRIHEAWQFLRFLALKNSGNVTLFNAITKNSKEFPINFDPAITYLTKTKQPAARRDIIEAQKTDVDLAPFVRGNLIAKHWYQVDPQETEKILIELIESTNRSDSTLREGLTLAGNKINYLSGSRNKR
ncbi:MAG: hypothetical protein ACD_8C00094G0012 [uncultured bacterium]|nr:MAG: hypothetical protein ACD_8C00094G0012 [uncultured bacterium]